MELIIFDKDKGRINAPFHLLKCSVMKNKINILIVFIILLSSCGQSETNKVAGNIKSDSLSSIPNSTFIDHKEKVFKYEKEFDSLKLYNYEGTHKCDLKTLVWIDSLLKVKTLNEKDIFTLFKSTNPHCSKNAEYSQMVNECLWKSLINNPEKFAWTLSFSTIQKEQKDFIISKIRNPINDSFHIKGLVKVIENSKLGYYEVNSVKELINALSQLK